MRLLRPSAVKRAAKKTLEALDLLNVDLEKLKKECLNGHYHEVHSQLVMKKKAQPK
jgi:hypothetical protein